MESLIWKCSILHLMNTRYSITNIQNVDQIKRATEQFPWEKLFRNFRVNKMVYFI